MSHLYLTRKLMLTQQPEFLSAGGSNNIVPDLPRLRRMSSYRSGSLANSAFAEDNDVEDLEMLLEAYFMQLDGTHNKILSVMNIQLDNQRNELIQLQLTLTIASFAIALDTCIAGVFGMNIPCPLYNIDGIFSYFVGGTTGACILVYFMLLGYARWKKLLGS
ncbi:hypothetical protein MLD38_026897 [Melastoma candidum]|uniref:Uncharacterized protein n=1 Tax=Melastoma candidum TaxID=119954 RepID=A0ACB9NZW2_9MYRT|nr:hypothetical protein MLD38_026897 [Melastoma candidum]